MRNQTNTQGDDRKTVTHRVTLVGTLVDAVLSFAKLSVGLLANSPALIADGLHSLSDLVTDGFILLVNQLAHAEPDEDHPYGHGRFETLGTVFLGLVLFSVGVGMALEYGERLINNAPNSNPSYWALGVVVLALIGKEWLFHYTMAAAKRVRSSLLEANAWHSRSDSLSSLVVLGGIGATIAGFPILEIVAAFLVALLIAKMGVTLAWDAIQQLADKGLKPEEHEQISSLLGQVPGVDDVHMLRTRLMGNHVLVDVHIQVADDATVSEGHQIGEWAMANLRQGFPDIKDITLHIDFEDDKYWPPHQLAPLRPDIENFLQAFQHLAKHEHLQIHYLQQQVTLDLFIREPISEKLLEEKTSAVQAAPWLAEIRFFQQLDPS